jgi:hypothetical protein
MKPDVRLDREATNLASQVQSAKMRFAGRIRVRYHSKIVSQRRVVLSVKVIEGLIVGAGQTNVTPMKDEKPGMARQTPKDSPTGRRRRHILMPE